MDKTSVFRDLVAGKFIPGFNYFGQCFSFETVFFVSGHSYHCCSCAFENEYIHCILANGKTDKTLCNKITKCIKEGKCPHVNSSPNHHVTGTKIYGIHIATATGTQQVLATALAGQHGNEPSGLFGITPTHMAYLKCQPNMLKLLLKIYSKSPHDQFLLYCSRNRKKFGCIQMEYIPLVELCARTNKVELLELFLEGHSVVLGLHNALKYIFEHKLEAMQVALMKYMNKTVVKGNLDCLYMAMVYNKPEIFESVLEYISQFSIFKEGKERLLELGTILNRKQCIEKLANYEPLERNKISEDKGVEYLLELLMENFEQLKDKIVPLLKANPDLCSVLNGSESGTPYIHSFVKNEFPKVEAHKIQALLVLGRDPGSHLSENSTVLSLILSRQADPDILPTINYPKLRKTIELCLSFNADFVTNDESANVFDSIITCANTIDQKLNKMVHFPLIELDCLQMDGMEQTFSGHDFEDNLALNFVLPLLIHCGLPFKRKDLAKIQTALLHPAEQNYIRQCMTRPRPLMLRCRDVLRNTFRGRKIYTFMKTSNVPKAVEKFILLEDVLQLLNTNNEGIHV